MGDFINNYMNTFSNLPKVVLKKTFIESFENDELDGIDENIEDEKDKYENEHNTSHCINDLDTVILQLREEKFPGKNVPGIGLFAVLVQQRLGGKPCLAEIENRVRQWQMNKWKGIA